MAVPAILSGGKGSHPFSPRWASSQGSERQTSKQPRCSFLSKPGRDPNSHSHIPSKYPRDAETDLTMTLWGPLGFPPLSCPRVRTTREVFKTPRSRVLDQLRRQTSACFPSLADDSRCHCKHPICLRSTVLGADSLQARQQLSSSAARENYLWSFKNTLCLDSTQSSEANALKWGLLLRGV